MSTQPGNPDDLSYPAVALGAAAGQNFALNPSAQILVSVVIVYVATATAGNRVPVLRILSSEGNIIWSVVFGTAVTANQTSRLLAGAGVQPVANTTPLQQIVPLPTQFTIEASCTIQILDAANIDVLDTVQVNLLLTL